MTPKITALVVMDRERRRPLLDHLEACGVDLVAAASVEEALPFLSGRRDIQVVFASTSIAGRNWLDLLAALGERRVGVELILCPPAEERARCGDLFRRGVFDLLFEPFQKPEVEQVAEAAASRFYMKSLAAASLPDIKAAG